MNRFFGFFFCLLTEHAYSDKSIFDEKGVYEICPRCKRFNRVYLTN